MATNYIITKFIFYSNRNILKKKIQDKNSLTSNIN